MSKRHERAKHPPQTQATAASASNSTPWPPAGIRPNKTFLLVAAVLFFVWNACLVWMWLRG